MILKYLSVIIILTIILIIAFNIEEFKNHPIKTLKKGGSLIGTFLLYNIQKLTMNDWNVKNNLEILRLPLNYKPSSVHVLIAHYNEDLSWSTNLKYPYTIISRKNIKSETIPNKGNEASMYLEYIIKNYNSLSDVTFFVHGHRNDWHHYSYVDQKINLQKFQYKYYNINDANIIKVKLHEHIKQLFDELQPILKISDYNNIWYRKSAQFYVTKDAILSHSIDYYKKLLNWIYYNKNSSYITGRIFEYIWHYIFTGSLLDLH